MYLQDPLVPYAFKIKTWRSDVLFGVQSIDERDTWVTKLKRIQVIAVLNHAGGLRKEAERERRCAEEGTLPSNAQQLPY